MRQGCNAIEPGNLLQKAGMQTGGVYGTDLAVERARALLARDPEVRAAVADDGLLALLGREQSSTLALFREAVRVYAERPCLGERPRLHDGAFEARYRTISYAALWDRVVALASGWQKSGFVAAGDFVGICGFAGIDFVVIDLACLYLGAVSVPMQSSASSDEMRHIVADTSMRCLACSQLHLATAEPVLVGTSLRSLVLFDVSPGSALPTLSIPCLTVTSLEATSERVAPYADDDRERLLSIMYTSGTTGTPKGAMYLDRTWAGRLSYAVSQPPVPVITVGAMPLNHVFGRFTVYRTMMRGGHVCFVARGDMSTLLDDIRLARPTVLTVVPRATAAMHQHFQTRVLELRESGFIDAEDRVLAEMRDTYLGDRLCLLFTGSAATAYETVVFLERCFGVPVVQLYGFNEFGAISQNERVDPWVEYRLVDVPELGYSTSDKPFPRGELWVRSRFETAGYWNLPDVNAHLLDADGFMRSGDVMEERAPNHLVWVDRKNGIVKLSQGEFVSLTRLEDLFRAGSALISQISIYASSKRAYVLAVIVPDFAALRSVGASDDQAVRHALAAELARMGVEAKLPSREVPRDFVLAHQPFTQENGLLTESGKQKRAFLNARYGPQLETLYDAIEARQIVGATNGESALERARSAIAATLGVSEVDLSRSFVALGGDSFSAVRLASLLEKALGVAAPVSALLDASRSLSHLVASLESRGANRVEIAVDGRVTTEALSLDRFLPEQLLVARSTRITPRAVLLTGASGFLGRFLALELLESVERVVCLVRASNDEAAQRRFESCFDAALRARFDAVASRVEVVAGDLSQTRFGLSDARYDALANQIDVVVHNGALVNHALGFGDLFEPNVLGTVEVIRFVLSGRSKSLAFVSSSGVAAQLGRVVTERETAEALSTTRVVDDSEGSLEYAGGYAASKWAAEVLLGDLHRRTRTPVQILRCSMILPPRGGGPVNEGDNVTRLLRSLLATRIAPRSFYDRVASAHFDGIPVDFVAAAISAIAREAEPGAHTYHVSNARWNDGISLDTFAAAIALQQPLERIEYPRWFNEVRARLEQCDEPIRKASLLPIVERWKLPAKEGFSIRLDNTHFRDKLRALLGVDDVPALDDAYLADLVRSLR